MTPVEGLLSRTDTASAEQTPSRLAFPTETGKTAKSVAPNRSNAQTDTMTHTCNVISNRG